MYTQNIGHRDDNPQRHHSTSNLSFDASRHPYHSVAPIVSKFRCILIAWFLEKARFNTLMSSLTSSEAADVVCALASRVSIIVSSSPTSIANRLTLMNPINHSLHRPRPVDNQIQTRSYDGYQEWLPIAVRLYQGKRTIWRNCGRCQYNQKGLSLEINREDLFLQGCKSGSRKGSITHSRHDESLIKLCS